MPLLSRIRDLFLDFIFPKSARVIELETLSVDTILKTLPPAEASKDKNVLAAFDYSHPLAKEMVWELKYKGNKILAEKLAVILFDIIEHELNELSIYESSWRKSPILLMPIPISGKRHFERGWNQAELLTERIAALDAQNLFKYLPGQLVKARHTESQTKTASRSERLKNVSDSMKVMYAPAVAGNNVILVDDVVTTGSTFSEARRALRQAGAKKTLCIAVAH